MSYKAYSITVAVVFLIITVLHFFRLIFSWNANIGGWEIPLWLSVVFLIFAGYLSYQGFRSRE